MNRSDTQLREQRKKILLLEGALHRLELADARAQFKHGLHGKTVAGLVKPMLTAEKILPLAAGLLPLVLGKGGATGWLRRVLLIAGAGISLYRILRKRYRVVSDEKSE